MTAPSTKEPQRLTTNEKFEKSVDTQDHMTGKVPNLHTAGPSILPTGPGSTDPASELTEIADCLLVEEASNADNMDIDMEEPSSDDLSECFDATATSWCPRPQLRGTTESYHDQLIPRGCDTPSQCSPRSDAEDDFVEDMDLSQDNTIAAHTRHPLLQPPQTSSAAKPSTKIAAQRPVEPVAPVPSCAEAAAADAAAAADRRRREREELELQRELVMHNWRLLHTISASGSGRPAPPAPPAPLDRARASFELASNKG